MDNPPNAISIWVKAPPLKGAKLALVSECLRFVAPDLWKRLQSEYFVLTFCPELHGQANLYGKLASMIRSSRPSEIAVFTIDGSPHCFTIHAAVNEAAYILGEHVRREHFVVVFRGEGYEVVRISPEAVRVARYLSLVDKLLKRHPEILRELASLSLEYKLALETNDAELRV